MNALIAVGRKQGYLTFSQVNDYLPDEDVNPDKLDNLLMSIEELGLEIRRDTPKAYVPRAERGAANGSGKAPKVRPVDFTEGESGRRIDDPVRMYLTQMGEIPLLKREEEISLAKTIELTRKRFRRHLLASDYALREAVDILAKVHDGELPFDRTIKVSVTEGLEKEQILGRMPHNLHSLRTLMQQNVDDFEVSRNKS